MIGVARKILLVSEIVCGSAPGICFYLDPCGEAHIAAINSQSPDLGQKLSRIRGAEFCGIAYFP